MSHASFSYDAGEVKKEKVVFPVPRFWGGRPHVFLSEYIALRKATIETDEIVVERNCKYRFDGSLPAPPDATVTLRITAGDGTEEVRVVCVCFATKEKAYWIRVAPGEYVLLQKDAGMNGHDVGEITDVVYGEPLPPGTVTTIKFYNDPTREKRIDVEVTEPPKPNPVVIQTGEGKIEIEREIDHWTVMVDVCSFGKRFNLTDEQAKQFCKAIEAAEAAQ